MARVRCSRILPFMGLDAFGGCPPDKVQHWNSSRFRQDRFRAGAGRLRLSFW